MKQIIVTINRCGDPQIKAEGFVGNACVNATRPIEQALSDGAGVDRSYGPEYYQSTDNTNQVQVRNW